jgi:transposase InsO family protein
VIGPKGGAPDGSRFTTSTAAPTPVRVVGAPPPGIVHHSDRGVQCACNSYVELLQQNGSRISMSRNGNPYDNAQSVTFRLIMPATRAREAPHVRPGPPSQTARVQTVELSWFSRNWAGAVFSYTVYRPSAPWAASEEEPGATEGLKTLPARSALRQCYARIFAVMNHDFAAAVQNR